MAQVIHDISFPNDGLGDPLRTAFDNQNQMNTELYTTKVDKELGKGLSSNDYDNTEKSKLAGIEDGAEVNVQADWTQEDTGADDFIKNKPDSIGCKLIREDFVFSGSQVFFLSQNYSQVYSVEVQGQGALSLSQYTLTAPNTLTINDTLDSGDYIVVIYSNADARFIEDLSNFIFVESLDSLPNPTFGVITLEDNKTYYFTTSVDLLGNRLVGGENTTILGASSEVSILNSTGLGVGVPLLTSIYTTPIRHIAIKDVDTAVSFDGTSNPNDMALDWTGVNFVNVPNIGTIKEASNFIFDKGAFLNSKEMNFDGTIGTIALNNSLFIGDGLTGSILEVLSTCTITRRFRVTYSSVIATSSTIGINVSSSASVPNESYILDTVNFSGGGTYLSGVAVTDNKTLFINCKGISNTAEISQYYMNENATTTTIAGVGVPVKVSGTTTSVGVTQKFTNTNNRATYNGSFTRFFRISATLSFESGNNNQIGSYIAKNGSILSESVIYGTTSGTGRAENVSIQTLVELSTNDYIEIFVENGTSSNNVLVTELNVIVI